MNRCAIFLDGEDRHHYRRVLREVCRRHGVCVHAFVLMDNHVHLLLSAVQSGVISQALRRAGQAYVQAFNLRHGRCGTLWQGRFRSSLVDSDAYALRVIRYIELNPVRAAMVERPDHYKWSSVHTHLGTAQDPLLTPHPVCLALAADRAGRASGVAPLAQCPARPGRNCPNPGLHGTGACAWRAPFQAMVEKALDRPASLRRVDGRRFGGRTGVRWVANARCPSRPLSAGS